MARVLVVDDNEALAEDVTEILEEAGHEARCAFSPSAALEEARAFPFDAALLDIRMPEMDGVTLARLLVGSRPEATFMFMTAYSSDKVVQEAMALSSGATLAKPLDLERLTRLMSAVA